jgi:hypothetical protein
VNKAGGSVILLVSTNISDGEVKQEVLGKTKRLLRTSQETHYVTATKPKRLILFGETVAVYCENHTEHTDTLCGQNAESVPHKKHITSQLQSPNGYYLGKQLLFIVGTIRNTQIHCVGRMQSPYLTGNTLRHLYKVQTVNTIWGNSRCLL